MRCGIQDTELLQSHWDLHRLEWRKVVAAACQHLEKQLPSSFPAEGCVRSRCSLKVAPVAPPCCAALGRLLCCFVLYG